MLHWLWTRLSEAGTSVLISRRVLRRFPDVEVDRLVRARVLIEQGKADTWSVCAHCDCGLDARPIRTVRGNLRACCPHDPAADVMLEPDDLRRFVIDQEQLAGQIAASARLPGEVKEIVSGIWSIGHTPSAIPIVLCCAPHILETPGILLSIRAAVGSSMTIMISHDLSSPAIIRLQEAGFSNVDLLQVLEPQKSEVEALDLKRLDAAAKSFFHSLDVNGTSVPRLVISRKQRTVQLDGCNILLSVNGFEAFLAAAEKISAGQVMLTYQELYELTNRANHRDVMNEIRDQIEKHGFSRDQTFDLVKTVRGRGMTLGLARSEINIRD